MQVTEIKTELTKLNSMRQTLDFEKFAGWVQITGWNISGY